MNFRSSFIYFSSQQEDVDAQELQTNLMTHFFFAEVCNKKSAQGACLNINRHTLGIEKQCDGVCLNYAKLCNSRIILR